ncbi:DNA/RNA non-specific endonuclease [Acinetobacter larvae]|uniref:Endonuclease n=1 Tax=Acinetobacter larvae TaxID=1789224 RepID=A0A1B2LVY2_9GAMM|nr:DNA/RNA non-specific endonuclease [Acinetobacter larvae]AOA57121.1 endonuclease [Acinetobacter larvae]
MARKKKVMGVNATALQVLIGLVLAGASALFFGKEQVTQYIPSLAQNNNRCLSQFYADQPPYLSRASLEQNSFPLCFNGFNVMYSGISKTPLWTAEHLTVSRLSQKIPREDQFHEESRVPQQYRALLSDYRGSGYDRGHMAPNGDMGDRASQKDSFSLANMVPQAPKNNQEVWRKLEEATRSLVLKNKQEIYVVTGPVYRSKKLKTIGKGVIVPDATYKVLYIPKTGVLSAYYAPNNNSLQVQVISVCQLEEYTGINFFPSLSTDQKRNVYRLPLSAAQVKANKPIAYDRWDGSSRCAEAVSSERVQKLQKRFQSSTSDGNIENQSTLNSQANASESELQQLIKNVLRQLLAQL